MDHRAPRTLRPVAYGRRGVIASANALASQAALRMYAAGGNAVDAAVAAAFACTVAEPYYSSICGVGTLLVTLPGQKPRALDYLGRAPAALDVGRLPRQPDHRGPDPDSICSVGIPSALAAWARVLEEYGTRPLADVIAPAIELAEAGVPLQRFDFEGFEGDADRLHAGYSRSNYLPEGRAVRPGDVLHQRDLAASFRKIAAEGAAALYEGSLADAIVREMRERGGLITRKDLADYPGSLAWSEPVSTEYRGVQVYTSPPPTSAFQLLASLAVAEGWPLGDMDHLGPDHLAILAESVRAARMDTERWAGDPDFVSVPVAELLSPGHIAELRARVEERLHTGGGAGAASPGPDRAKSSTTHVAAFDASGLGINMTHSMGWGFGCGVVVEGTGIALNHSLHWGRLEPGHNNELVAGKRHEWPIAPAQLFRGGRLWAVLGTPGNYGILATTAQVISNLVDFGFDIQQAIESPRFRWTDDTTDALPPRRLVAETRIPASTRDALAARGYDIEWVSDWTWRVGGMQGAAFDPNSGWLSAGADPRRNGYAQGW
ncbi:MAG TPA: gamma-glutamyltransferase [Kofleriaceae bacterium]|nr:gamma-glutamyltransferase [Kofleriaceae bacterium]